MVFQRDCATIEEAPAVVELDLTGSRELLQERTQSEPGSLRGNRLSQRVLPEITHQAAPGALAVGQKDRGDRNNFAGGRVFFLNEECVRPRGIELVALWTAIQYPAIALAAFLGIDAPARSRSLVE